MSVSYENAMKQLQSMFTDFDRDTIKSVLISNKGYLEKTIEDLLQMTPENEEGAEDFGDDNLFSKGFSNKPQNKPIPKQNKQNSGLFEDPELALGVPKGDNLGLYFEDDEDKTRRMARDLQEKEDMKLAYQLQQEYLKQMQAEGGEGEEYEEGEEGEEEDDDGNPGNNSGPGRAYRTEEQKSNGNMNQSGQPEKKKKKGFGSKIKSAFASLFKKKKKGGAVKGPGEYAEVGDDDLASKQKMSSTAQNFSQGLNKPNTQHQSSFDRPSTAQNFSQGANKPNTQYQSSFDRPSNAQQQQPSYYPDLDYPPKSTSTYNQSNFQSSFDKPKTTYNQPVGQPSSLPKKSTDHYNQPQQKVQPPREESDDEGDIKQLQFDQLDEDDEQKNEKPIQLSDILNGGNDDEDDDPVGFTNNKTKKNFMADGESSPIGYDHFNYRK